MQTTSKIQQKGHNDYDNEVITIILFFSLVQFGVWVGHKYRRMCCYCWSLLCSFAAQCPLPMSFFINFILNMALEWYEWKKSISPHKKKTRRKNNGACSNGLLNSCPFDINNECWLERAWRFLGFSVLQNNERPKHKWHSLFRHNPLVFIVSFVSPSARSTTNGYWC